MLVEQVGLEQEQRLEREAEELGHYLIIEQLERVRLCRVHDEQVGLEERDRS